MKKKVIIIGAGPAGLTAGLELLRRAKEYHVVIYEQNDYVGGISATIEHEGNLMDLGGHRFFTKNSRVQNWWFSVLPIRAVEKEENFTISYQNQTATIDSQSVKNLEESSKSADKSHFLIRERYSRILFNRHFLSYPIKLEWAVFKSLGLRRALLSGVTYFKRQLFPKYPEESLEDFFINRFGDTLYENFFKEYTEKVWGESCRSLSADWGAQRIKGLSVRKILSNMIFSKFQFKKKGLAAEQRKETSLIEKFLYPARGPGQFWQEVQKEFVRLGGEIHLEHNVCSINAHEGAFSVRVSRGELLKEDLVESADAIISSMPIPRLIDALGTNVRESIRILAQGLKYRDFITIGLLYPHLTPKHIYRNAEAPLYLNDTWLYVQEPGYKVGRIQLFNNWSPHLVADSKLAWVGLEYFVNKGDELWQLSDSELTAFATREFEQLGFADSSECISSRVVRVAKAYPVYSGNYARIGEIVEELAKFPGIYPVGRNGMHRYNNQDHSMLTALESVDQLLSNQRAPERVWKVNTEQSYSEELENDK